MYDDGIDWLTAFQNYVYNDMEAADIEYVRISLEQCGLDEETIERYFLGED